MESGSKPTFNDPDDGVIVKALGVLLAPFVVASEALGRVVMGFFGTAERLNPGPLLRRLVQPLEKLALRAARWFRNPWRRVEQATDRLLRAVQRALTPVTSRLRLAASRIKDTLNAFGRAVLRSTANFRARVSQAWSAVAQVWDRATDPVKRSLARIQTRLRR